MNFLKNHHFITLIYFSSININQIILLHINFINFANIQDFNYLIFIKTFDFLLIPD